MKRVYIDGIFDLFHRGHLESLKQAKNVDNNVYLIVGVISDKDARDYKRVPVINQEDRTEIIKGFKIVNEVIDNAPLILTKEFINIHKIDLVVHGFCNDDDWDKQKLFFEYLIKEDKFQRIDYYSKTSTTDIINKIKHSY